MKLRDMMFLVIGGLLVISGLIKEIQKEIKQGEILKQLDDYKNSQQEGIQDRWFRRQDRR